jgi:hypothetical protein
MAKTLGAQPEEPGAEAKREHPSATDKQQGKIRAMLQKIHLTQKRQELDSAAFRAGLEALDPGQARRIRGDSIGFGTSPRSLFRTSCLRRFGIALSRSA